MLFLEVKGIKNAIRAVTKFITSAAVIIIVMFALLVVGVKLLGYNVYIVLSPSMEPEIKTGSVIYTKDAVISELEKGDIITFSIGGGKTATHRIDQVIGTGDDKSFITKGDANDNADGQEVKAKDVVGECVFWIPYLGFVVHFVQSQIGIYVSIGTVAMIVILMMLPDILFGDEEKKEKGKKKGSKAEELPLESTDADNNLNVNNEETSKNEGKEEEIVEKDS